MKETYGKMKTILKDMKFNARSDRLKSDDLMMKELNTLITKETVSLSQGATYDRNKMVRPNQRLAPEEKP